MGSSEPRCEKCKNKKTEWCDSCPLHIHFEPEPSPAESGPTCRNCGRERDQHDKGGRCGGSLSSCWSPTPSDSEPGPDMQEIFNDARLYAAFNVGRAREREKIGKTHDALVAENERIRKVKDAVILDLDKKLFDLRAKVAELEKERDNAYAAIRLTMEVIEQVPGITPQTRSNIEIVLKKLGEKP